MKLPPLPVVVRIALVIAALACAAWLREGHYAIGLDFEGGVRMLVHPHGDPQQTLLHALRSRPDAKIQREGDTVSIELDDGDENDARAIEHDLASDADRVSLSVIDAAHPHWMGRPLAILVAFAAALCWLGLFALPRAWPLGVLATFFLGWTLTVVDNLALGGTLTLPLQLAGMLLGLAAAPAARPAAGDPLLRLRAAWPAGVLLLLVLVAATIVITTFEHAPAGDYATLAYFALKLARHPAIAVAAVAALSSIAATSASG